MKVEVLKPFRFSPDGNTVESVSVGTEVEGRCAEVALQMKCGREIKAHRAAPKNKAKK